MGVCRHSGLFHLIKFSHGKKNCRFLTVKKNLVDCRVRFEYSRTAFVPFCRNRVCGYSDSISIRRHATIHPDFDPIGFSFTLSRLFPICGCISKTNPAEEDLIDFAVFLAYFPHLLSGPIERAKTFLPQLKNPRLVQNDMLAESGWLILAGLFRKLVLASLLFTLILKVYSPGLLNSPRPIGGQPCWSMASGYITISPVTHHWCAASVCCSASGFH